MVRIYRRATGVPENCAGVVDVIGSGARHAFGSLDELLAILRAGDRTHGKAALFVVHEKSDANRQI